MGMTMPLSGPLFLCVFDEGLEQEVRPLIVKYYTGLAAPCQSWLIEELGLVARLSIRVEVSHHEQRYQLTNLTGMG